VNFSLGIVESSLCIRVDIYIDLTINKSLSIMDYHNSPQWGSFREERYVSRILNVICCVLFIDKTRRAEERNG